MADEEIRMKITVDGRAVTLEGPADFVREEIRRITDRIGTESPPASGHADGTRRLATTERELIADKRPANQPETVAVLGFYLTEVGQPEFNEEDIRKAYIRAGVRPPKVVAQALRDAKNNFDLIESGAKRGMFRLTTHGDRTVRFDLPRGHSGR